MRNYVQPGHTITVPAPSGGVSSGDPALIGALFGVAAYGAAEGADVELHTTGVFRLPKTSALAINVGDKVYFDATNKVVNKTSSGNTLVGVAVSGAVNPSATVNVRLGIVA